MAIIQVTFNPSLWTAGSGSPGQPGSNGYNCYTVVPDQDGTSLWCFEYFGAGFARVRLSDGVILHQGLMFGTEGGFSNYWYNREDGSSAFAQDDLGNYYVMPNHSSTNTVLYKFQVGSGSAGNLLDGYCTNGVTTLDLSGFVGNEGGTGVRNVEGWNQVVAPAADGNRYLAICNDGGSPANVIINTATMAVVGNYSHAAGATYWASFVDKNGDFWFVVSKGDIPHTVTLVHWHPQDGVTGPNLNVTEHEISAVTLGTGTNGIQFGGYIPASHSVFLGNSISDTGQSVNISLTTFTQNAFHADDLKFFYNGTFDVPQSALMNGVQGDGKLAIPGSVTPVPSFASLGGILNIIDPTALTSFQTFDVTAAIIAATFLAGGTFFDFHYGTDPYTPFGNMVYSEAAHKVAVSYEFIGSALYLVDVVGPPTIFATVSPSEITVTGSATLSWTTTGATSLSCPELGGSIPLTGSAVVDPSASFFWHFTATGPGGTATAVVELVVLSPDCRFNLQKIILTLKQEPSTPVRGRGGSGGR